jgi:hypothetical protein
MLIFRPEMHGIETDHEGNSTKGFAKIFVGKLRLLPKYDVKCNFTGLRFTDYQPEYKSMAPVYDNPLAGITNNYEKPPF